MNEFIVWDENRKIFLTKDSDFDRLDDSSDRFYELDEWFPVSNASVLFGCLKLDKKRFTICRDIGKTDIEGNKIYADSSIVEFDYSGGSVPVRMMGYFYFDEHHLCYAIKNDAYRKLLFTAHKVENLLIVGNLQQNKELLDESH